MLSEALLRKRLGIFTGSENHRLMGGIKKQPVKRDAENFEAMYEALKPIREKGLEKPNVSDLKDKYPFTTGKLKDAAWSALIEDEPTKGLISYAHEKALEEFFYPDPEAQVETRSMAIGNEREGTAVQLLADELGIQFVHTGEDQVHEIRNGLGSTPDGLAVNELTSLFCSGAEAKCFDVEHHAEMWLINNNSQLERLAPKIWWSV